MTNNRKNNTTEMKRDDEYALGLGDDIQYSTGQSAMENGARSRTGTYSSTASTLLAPIYPAFELILKLRRGIATLDIACGVVGFIVSFFLDDTTTVLGRNVPSAGEEVGKLKTVPLARSGGVTSPIRVICGFAVVIGCMLLLTCKQEVYYIYMRQIRDQHLASIAYWTTCIQSILCIVTIMQISGVATIHELLLAGALTFAEFSIYTHSDVINRDVTNNWEIYDALVVKQHDNPAICVQSIKKNVKIDMEHNMHPVYSAAVVHMVILIVVMYRMSESLSGHTYTTDPWYVTAVFVTLFLQSCILVFKLIGIWRLPLAHVFYAYRFYIVSIETIACVNIFFLIVLLIFAGL